MLYVRLWLSLARFSLIREFAFRTNFLVKIFVEVLWLTLLLGFYYTLFDKTDNVAGWSQEQYLFFVGLYFAMSGLLEMLFLDNCNNFADLVRTGDLDFFLIKPIDEQFLVSCRSVDWSCFANVLMGSGVMVMALIRIPWQFNVIDLGTFIVMFVCGLGLAYGFLLMLTSASVWFMRNQSLFEMWWLATSLMRYPREVFLQGYWAVPVGVIFYFAFPIMLVTNVPAQALVRGLDPWVATYTLVATIAVIWTSRRLFRLALTRYRSASS